MLSNQSQSQTVLTKKNERKKKKYYIHLIEIIKTNLLFPCSVLVKVKLKYPKDIMQVIIERLATL